MSIILNSVNEYRGYLINEFTMLERALDKHLLLYFFPMTIPIVVHTIECMKYYWIE